MSLFHNVEEKLENHAVDVGVKRLGKDGRASAVGFGTLIYDPIKNKLEIDPDPKILARIKAEWDKYHR